MALLALENSYGKYYSFFLLKFFESRKITDLMLPLMKFKASEKRTSAGRINTRGFPSALAV
jgi:hypothetical protein